ncbi:kunitz/Bovine pancreatic trypsin inhibitor domain-containing protein [Phthorimaea operculella]|nr:kunitz/Bovine pancreatic trypsin inhibitor domain-containing protein [Phthorimaea operculella]
MCDWFCTSKNAFKEENRKCMQPQCTEQETDISDPSCPTTEWAAWSPCSASCGRGVRFRTRLLLVPADRQQECSAKVELMQQRPCQEQQDCTVDMATAKRICMEQPDQGPCRGLYQRWAFVAAKGMCVPFNYGGCRGTRNNFISQEDCLNTCSLIITRRTASTPAASSSVSSWSRAKGMCVPFNYGGCRGTRNNFISQEDCLNTCSLIITRRTASTPAASSSVSSGSRAKGMCPSTTAAAEAPGTTSSARRTASTPAASSSVSSWSRAKGMCPSTTAVGHQEPLHQPGGLPQHLQPHHQTPGATSSARRTASTPAASSSVSSWSRAKGMCVPFNYCCRTPGATSSARRTASTPAASSSVSSWSRAKGMCVPFNYCCRTPGATSSARRTASTPAASSSVSCWSRAKGMCVPFNYCCRTPGATSSARRTASTPAASSSVSSWSRARACACPSTTAVGHQEPLHQPGGLPQHLQPHHQ